MNHIDIRQATLKDTLTIQKLNHALFRLEKECFDPTLVTNWPLSAEGKKYFEDLITKAYVIVAVKDAKIVGYLAGSIQDKCPYTTVQYGEINNMFVTKENRGHGIGKALVDHFKKYCADQHIHHLKVVASAQNKGAQKFYEKQSFNAFDITLTLSLEQ